MSEGLSVRGVEEVQRKMEQAVRDLEGGPMLQAMRDCTLLVERDAKKNASASVNTGMLRASILPEVRGEGHAIMGVVGSNLLYAAAVELGSRPHWPPPDPILRWVQLKLQPGKDLEASVAFLIARKIARMGTKAQPYLQPAFDMNLDRIEQRLGSAVSEIVVKANS